MSQTPSNNRSGRRSEAALAADVKDTVPAIGDASGSRPHTGSAAHAGKANGWLLAVAATAVAVIVVLLALTFGSAIVQALPGLPDAGPVTAWGLPLVRLMTDGLAIITVGMAVTAAFLLPGDGRTVSAYGYLLLRRTAVAASAWTLSALALIVLTVSDILGMPVSTLGVNTVLSFATAISQGQALLIQAGLALMVALLAAAGLSRGLAATVAILTMIAILPPAFTGHAAGAGNHQIAVTSMALHVLGAALWFGGLAALLMVRRSSLLGDAAARYSRLALGCFTAIVVSGAASAAVRLGDLEQLWRSEYGWLVAGKLVALLALGAFGAFHRARSIPALREGRPGAFARLTAGELIVFAATTAVAVVLSRTAPPVPEDVEVPDPITDLLGFAMPAPLTVSRLFGQPLPDMFFLTLVAVGVGFYLAGVQRLRRAGNSWPVGRTISWLAGMLLLGAITDLGIARYAYVLFSVHMVQHMVLTMLVPILLVGGAPITLALRALRRPADPQQRGVREWLLIVLHSKVMKVITHPVYALAVYMGSLFGLYFSDLFVMLMRTHLGHLAMLMHFVLGGYLLVWTLIGIDPGRRRVPHAVLVIVHLVAMMAHGFFGLVLMQTTMLLASDWYSVVHPAWAASLLDDQRLGAGIAWAFGELPGAVIMVILVRQWFQADRREQARLDRAADRAEASGEDDELARYNAFLQEAARQDAERAARSGR